MNKLSLQILCVTCLLVGATTALSQEATTDNPKPAEGDLVLPMPGGGQMVFRPVFLGADMDEFPVYSGSHVTIGDPKSGGFRESISTIFMSGSFLGKHEGNTDWLFYIGKYEVTEKQYAAVMTPETSTDETLAASNLSYLEMLEFIEAYNTWLRENHPDSLPKLDESSGYLRLPTEVEWEFSARGGIEVDKAKFDEPQPYGKRLNRSEWYSGPRSSHNQKQKVGVHQPNPLGLHDMLGNVSELTLTPYQLEYFQGRMGGLTAKGGNYLTQLKELRSSMRTEIPVIQEDGRATRQNTLGFRLVIGSPVFAGTKTIQDLRDNWKAYSEGNRKTDASTEAQSVSQFATKAMVSIDEGRKALEELETQVANSGAAAESMQRSLSMIESAFGTVQSKIAEADQMNATAWSRMAGFYAFETYQELQKIPNALRAIEIAKGMNNPAQLQLVEDRYRDVLANIDDNWAQFVDAMKNLSKLTPERVETGFQNYIQYLADLQNSAPQIRIVGLVKQQYREYVETGRLESEKWKEAFETLNQTRITP